jgi:hypothetical protein
MLNQFVSSGSTKLQCSRSASVAGFSDVLVDSSQNLCFCRRPSGKKASLCLKTPLVAIPLLGRLQSFHSRLFAMCPQPGCGIILEYSPLVWPALYPCNERGEMICSSCLHKRLLLREDAFEKRVRASAS